MRYLLFGLIIVVGCSPEPEFTNEWGVEYYTKERCILSHSEPNGLISYDGGKSFIYSSTDVCDSSVVDTFAVPHY